MLRRIISLVLALCMLLGIGLLAPAASAAEANLFQDANEIQYEEAVDILVGLDILDGTQPLEPEGTFTREMLATLIARVCLGDRYSGEEISTMYGKYENPFSDVSAGQWREGFISYCVQTGIIQGREDGTFDPTGGMTGIEFAKMLLGAVGYGDSPELEIPSLVDLTTEDGLLMTAAALNQPIAIWENGKVAYGETLAERNYGMPLPRIRKKISAGTFQLPETGRTEEMERLAGNKHYTNYTDRYQSHFPDASRLVVSANMIPTYSARKLNYILPEEDYTWADAAQFITTLLLGEEEAAKLTDGGMGYCMEEGYIPSDQDADDPITGTDLVKIMCTLLGNFWLDSAAGQFAATYGLLEGTTGKLGTANTELETMEDHTALNALLAEPLNRDNAMQMIYNFLNATMQNGEETVAEHFGIDLDKYQPKPANAQLAEVYHVTAVNPQTAQTVNVAVSVPADGEAFDVSIYPAGNNDAPYDQEGFDSATAGDTYTVKVPADTKITVDVLQAIISQIMSGDTVIFDVTKEITQDTGTAYTLSGGSNNSGVSWEITDYGMSATFNSGTGDVTVNTAPLDADNKAEITAVMDGEEEEITIQAIPDDDPSKDPAGMSLRSAAVPAAESSAAEPPAEEPPAAEPPAAEPPAAESPAAESPVAETPVAESPAAELPAAASPAVEPPAAEPPTGEESGSE